VPYVVRRVPVRVHCRSSLRNCNPGYPLYRIAIRSGDPDRADRLTIDPD
jgi:hypothetical protein